MFFPGRFKRVSPAAVELHVSMDLLSEALGHVTLTPDTFGERAELPEPGSLSGCLLLADRGYSVYRPFYEPTVTPRQKAA